VAVLAVAVVVMWVFVLVIMFVHLKGLRPARAPEMSMRSGVRMVVDVATMTMEHDGVRAAHLQHVSRLLP
jgi:hypothetical protein